MKIKDFEYNFIDKVYDFDGLWGVKSKCGLKVVDKSNNPVVIITELYDLNTGNSITDCCSILAKKICADNNYNPQTVTFIHHSPEINSKLDFYDETFEILTFKEEDFSVPNWELITREKVNEMIAG